MPELRVVHSKRKAAAAATALLFADNSEDEPEQLDQEDLDFIANDKEIGADETIIGAGKLIFITCLC
jgi:hypothetical protein